MKIGQLDVEQLDQPYYCVVQIRHQPPGVLHSVILRPDKITQTMRQCSMGHYHRSQVIVIGESPGDQAQGWQYPDNIYVVAILGIAVENNGKWECRPLHDPA